MCHMLNYSGSRKESPIVKSDSSKLVATGLRVGGLFSNRSTGSAVQGRGAYRCFAMRPQENVKIFENRYRPLLEGNVSLRGCLFLECIRAMIALAPQLGKVNPNICQLDT